MVERKIPKHDPHKEDLYCIYCQSKHVVRHGHRFTKALGKRQIILCMHCGRHFTLNRLFDPMHEERRDTYPRYLWRISFDLYYNGMSLKKITKHFVEVYGFNIHHTSVMHWIQCHAMQLSLNYYKKKKMAGGKL